MNELILVGMVYAVVCTLTFPWYSKNPWVQLAWFMAWYFGVVWGAVQIAKYFAT